MALYIRFTDTPENDLERNESYHLAGDICYDGCEWNDFFNCYAETLDGLCAYPLDSETIEEAIEEAENFRKDIFDSKKDSYCIMRGNYVGDCPEGDVISATEIVHVVVNDFWASK